MLKEKNINLMTGLEAAKLSHQIWWAADPGKREIILFNCTSNYNKPYVV